MRDNQDVSSQCFSCCLIGGSSLLVKCGELLLKQGHHILFVCSPELAVRQWADKLGIAITSHIETGIAEYSKYPCDYLFSIVNLHMLSQTVLDFPTKYAINYHDGPLPRYAGINTTSWAIYNGEKSHGISWHIMEKGPDEGDILKQRVVAIECQDTSYTLNLKCIEAGYDAFKELILELTTGFEDLKAQDFALRSYYPAYKRPDNGGFISWELSATHIVAMIRSFDFGPEKNTFGLAKLCIGKHVIAVKAVELLSGRAIAQPPGTIINYSEQWLDVVAKDNVLRLSQFYTLSGNPLTLQDMMQKYCLQNVAQFTDLDEDVAGILAVTQAAVCRHEAFWVKQVTNYRNPDLFHIKPIDNDVPLMREKGHASNSGRNRFIIKPPNSLKALIKRYNSTANPEISGALMLSIFVSFVSKLAQNETFSLNLTYPQLKKTQKKLAGIYASYIPFAFTQTQLEQNIYQLSTSVEQSLLTLIKAGTYLYDIGVRYPALVNNSIDGLIHVELAETVEDTAGLSRSGPSRSGIGIIIATETDEYLWDIDTQTFGITMGHQLQKQFTAFLGNLARQPDKLVSELSLLSLQENDKLVHDINRTSASYPNLCIHQLFQNQSKMAPEACALSYESQVLSYQALNIKSNIVASHLHAQGIGRHACVALFFERSIDMVVALFGVLKSGATYIPLDPIYPADRLSYILEDADVRLVLSHGSVDTGWLKAPLEALDINQLFYNSRYSHYSDPLALTSQVPTASDIAYIIYTSGSTGKPKGVKVTHRNLTNFLYGMTDKLELTTPVKSLALTTLCFDIAALELYLPLILGGQVEIISSKLVADGFLLNKKLAQSDATLIQATPATWKMLIASSWQGNPEATLLCGGEALPSELAKQLLSRGKQAWNMFGPTETTIWSSMYRLTDDNKIAIGRPISNTQMYILDRYCQPVPVGQPGELYIGGDGVSAGYLKRDALNREKFIDDPFSNKKDAKLFKTGDLVYYDTDYDIRYINRIDEQAKIHGYRIELGEIDSLMNDLPMVKEAVVKLYEIALDEKRLVAHIVLENSTPEHNPAKAIHDYLNAKLPHYMVPDEYVFMDNLPLTANKKIDRKALQLPVDNSQISHACLADATDTEQQVHTIWTTVLSKKNIGVDDNLFDVGGNSILLVSIQRELIALFDKSITRVDMFRYPTIRTLSQYIDSFGEAPQFANLERRGTRKKDFSALRTKRLKAKRKARLVETRD